MRSSSSPDSAGLHREIDHLLQAAGDVVFRLDLNGLVRFASAQAQRRLGSDTARPGAALHACVAAPDQPAWRSALAAALAAHPGAEPVQLALRLNCSGVECWFDLRLIRLEGDLLLVGRDISAQQATEAQLRHMATHDALTGLPNRLLLADRIRMVVAQSRRSSQRFAVVTIGIDGFKKVNDGLGLTVGDGMLKLAAARLRKTLRDSDTLARVAGDEFVAVLPGTHSAAQIRLVTGRLLGHVQTPFEVEGHAIYVSASIGVALYPEHAEDEVRLVALADAAMSHAKQTGRARCVVYDAGQHRAPEHDISLEAAMFNAVREGEFLLHYQPIVDARSRQI